MCLFKYTYIDIDTDIDIDTHDTHVWLHGSKMIQRQGPSSEFTFVIYVAPVGRWPEDLDGNLEGNPQFDAWNRLEMLRLDGFCWKLSIEKKHLKNWGLQVENWWWDCANESWAGENMECGKPASCTVWMPFGTSFVRVVSAWEWRHKLWHHRRVSCDPITSFQWLRPSGFPVADVFHPH